MGCTLDSGIKKHDIDKVHSNRHQRISTIDTRKKSFKVADSIIENVILNKELLTDPQINFAVGCLSKQSLFSALSASQLKVISGLLVPAKAKRNQYIFHQGDTGNCFFLIEKGEVLIQIDGKQIKTLGQGQSFGQLALILRAKRSAGVKAKQDCQLLIMKPLLFKETMEKLKSQEYEIKRTSIQKVPIFEGLTNKQKYSLANALKIMVYEKGERIFRQKQLANAFFIILEGTVAIQIDKKDTIHLKKYQSFGESAFLTKGRRQGSAIAIEKTLCAIIAKESFEKHLGTSADNIYFYNIKKWALKRSEVFGSLSEHTVNAINLAFETVFTKAFNPLRNDGVVICLDGSINQEGSGKIFGDKDWQQHNQRTCDLKQTQDGYSAYLNFQKLSKVIADLKKKKQGKRPSNYNWGSNKENFSYVDLESFQYIKELGEGQFGTVKLVKDPSLGRLYALKRITKKSIKSEGLEVYVEEQRKILQKIEFPYIVGFVKAFSDLESVYFLMEYIKGVQLFNVIREVPALNKTIARYFFAAIMLSIQHLHSFNIIYRDIKPQNAVVDHTGKVFLIDMGTAKFLKKQKSYRTYTVIGTPHYMAPQVFSAQGYSFQADIWSLGVLMYQFLCNKLPFGETQEDTYKVMQMVKREKIKYPKNLQPQAQQLLKTMLQKDPKERAIKANFQKIKQLSYFENFNWADMVNEKIFPPYVPKQFKNESKNSLFQMEGYPLLKKLYPQQFSKGLSVEFKQWNQTIKY